MRTSFILHLDSLEVLDELSNEDAGVLLKAMRDFNRDEDPNLSGLMKVIFLPFKNQFIRDEVKYDEKSDKRSEAGRKGNLKRYHPDLYTQVIDKQITLEEAESVAKGRNCEISDNLPSQVVAKHRYKDNDSNSNSEKENKSKHPKLTSDLVLLEIEKYRSDKMEGFDLLNRSSDFIKYFDVANGFRKIIMEKVKSNGGSVEKLKEAKVGTWIKPIRDMYVIDKIEGNSIKSVYKWLPTSDFWSKNILSTQSLRNKFNQLVAEAKNNTPIDTSKRIFG